MNTPELVIDALTYGDIPRCAALERRMFADDSPWPAAAFRAELNAPYNTYFAARERLGADHASQIRQIPRNEGDHAR